MPVVTARWVETAPLASAGRARGEQDGGVVLGRDLRQVRLAVAPSSGASASSSGCSTGSATVGIVQPPASSRLARGLVGDDQLGLGQSRRVAHLVGLPPAVDQGRDPARLQHRHVGDDPGRAVAHRDRDPVALGDVPARRPAPAPAASPARSARRRSAARSPAITASIGAVERAEGVEQAGQGRRQVGDDRPPLRRPRPIWMRPPAPVTSASTASILAVELARHPCSPRFAFFPPPSMKARA